MKEMLGGCCVCSDDRGWTENPLVYCDGQGCTVAVHQACYGIVTVPSGPWFCRKCESKERAAKVKCELCPSKDGALKRTDNSGWAHVVCALYIPEVRFGNVSTMEPIILSLVPPERYNKICYICESHGKESKAKNGACMNCNKSGCKYHFHVTCAQAMGLLCEEAGNYVDNVKYCGYCQHHYSKLKKGGNLKTIPAFKPLPAPGSNDSGPEKSNSHGAANWSSHQSSSGMNGSKEKNRKKPGRKSSSSSQVSPKAGNSRDSLNSSVIVETPESEDPKKTYKPEGSQFTDVLAGVGLVPGPKPAVSEAVSVSENCNSEPQDLHESSKSHDARISDAGKSSMIKKLEKVNDHFRSGSGVHLETAPTTIDRARPVKRKSSTRSVSPTSVGGNDTESTLSNVSDCGHSATSETITVGEQKSGDHTADLETSTSVAHSVIVSSNSVHHPENGQQYLKNNATPQRSVSPLTITGIQSAGGNSKLQIEQSRSGHSNSYSNPEKDHNGSVSASKKPRRGRAPKLSTPLAPDSPPSSPDSNAGGDHLAKRRKKVPRNSATLLPHPTQSHHPAPANDIEKNSEILEQTVTFPVSNDHQKIREISHVNVPLPDRRVTSIPTEMPVHQPLSVSAAPSSLSSSLRPHGSAGQDTKLTAGKQNGIVAPHMLGNQINPTSSVALKMTETLTAELEAKNVPNESPSTTQQMIGVPFPPRPSSPSSRSQLAQSLEHLLERQWEQSSQFLMEQAQHFDIATLLSHLHSLQLENRKLEDHVATLKKRREHLLSVKARLSVPLPMTTVSSFAPSGGLPERPTQCPSTITSHLTHSSPHERERSRVPTYLPTMENGVSEHISPYVVAGFPSPHGGQRPVKDSGGPHQSDRVIPSPVIVSSRGNTMFHPMGPTSIVPPTISPVQSGPNYLVEGRSMMIPSSPSSTPEIRPEMIRTSSTPSQHPHLTQPYAFQMVSPAMSAPPHHTGSLISSSLPGGIATSQQHSLNVRREVPDPRNAIGRPKSIERR